MSNPLDELLDFSCPVEVDPAQQAYFADQLAEFFQGDTLVGGDNPSTADSHSRLSDLTNPR